MLSTAPDSQATASAPTPTAKHFRQLQADELVTRGDYSANENQGFDPWEGPTGFRADAFVKPIYRKQSRRPAGTKKSA